MAFSLIYFVFPALCFLHYNGLARLTRRPMLYATKNYLKSSSNLSMMSDDKDSLQKPITLINTVSEVIDSVAKEKVDSDTFLKWDKRVISTTAELQQVFDIEELLDIYGTLLHKAATVMLNPLQFSTFESFTNAITDQIYRRQPANAALTDLIDTITDKHLEFIDSLEGLFSSRENDSKFSKENLCYQLAALIRLMYARLNSGLGSEYANNPQSQEMRLNNWVSPVYARLQRRFPVFNTMYVEEKLTEYATTSVDELCKRVDFSVSPPYTMTGCNRQNVEVYPGWELSNYIVKLLRLVSGTIDLKIAEPKIANSFKNDIAPKMSAIGAILEDSWLTDIYSNDEEKVIMRLEKATEMLNLGHVTVAAVLTVWHIRHNLVGVASKDEYGTEGPLIKDYLNPLVIGTKPIIGSIPKFIRSELATEVSELDSRLNPSPLLLQISVLAYAIRYSTAEEFRALVTYVLDPNNEPEDRDAMFMGTLSQLLSQVLLSETFDVRVFYENLLAMVALEESIGTREPRVDVSKAYGRALTVAVLTLVKEGLFSTTSTVVSTMADKIIEIERALGMMLRLPEQAGRQYRSKAFKDVVDVLLSPGSDVSFEDLKEYYLLCAKLFSIDPADANSYVKSISISKFDKTVGRLLRDSDVAIGVPGIGNVYVEQLHELSTELGIEENEAEERVMLLAAATFMSMMEVAVEQSKKRKGGSTTEAVLRKLFAMFKHPLLVELKSRVAVSVQDTGIKMIVLTIGVTGVAEILRLLDGCKQRLVAATGSGNKDSISTAGWGYASSSSSLSTYDRREGGDDNNDNEEDNGSFLGFVTSLQTDFMKEYASASLKQAR